MRARERRARPPRRRPPSQRHRPLSQRASGPSAGARILRSPFRRVGGARVRGGRVSWSSEPPRQGADVRAVEQPASRVPTKKRTRPSAPARCRCPRSPPAPASRFAERRRRPRRQTPPPRVARTMSGCGGVAPVVGHEAAVARVAGPEACHRRSRPRRRAVRPPAPQHKRLPPGTRMRSRAARPNGGAEWTGG